jgi:hypothetical protein
MLYFFIVSGSLTAGLIAHSKQRNVLAWAALGALMPLIAIIIAAAMPSQKQLPQ